MKLSAKTAAVKSRSILFTSALLFVLIPILFYTDITRAQSETGLALNPPVLTATTTGADKVELSWNAVSGAARFDLWAWTRTGDWKRLDEGELIGTRYTHSGLTAGTTYLYAIRAVDAEGTASAWSEYAEATVPEARLTTATPTPTQPPTSGPTPTPTATASASALAIPQLTAQATESGVLLTWEAVPHAMRYELVVWWDPGTDWQSLGDGSLTGTTYTHAEVTAGTTYYYSIRSLNTAGEASGWLLDYPYATALVAKGEATSTPTSTPEATPSPTQTPTSSSAATPTPTQTPTSTPTATASVYELAIPKLTAQATESGVLLTWEVVPHVVRYELAVWWDRGNGWRMLGGDGLTGTTFTHADVGAGTTYYYSIRALNAAGETSGWLLDYPYATALPATPTPTVTPTPGSTPTPAATDKGALIALYHATNGANWKRNNNWLTDKPIDLWYGVSADSNGRVSQLRLQRNGLEGTIPALSALSSLTLLDLGSNRLTGQIPDLGALSNLTHLDLGSNELSGAIPDLGALSNLTHLDLGSNWLSGSIPNLRALSNLTFLQLRSNRLTGRIPDLSALTSLKELRLSYNALTGPVPDLSALTNLGGLDLSYNGLTGPPPVLSDLTSLRYLNLSSNELSGPPLGLYTLINLELLDLSNNDFSGPVPDFSALVNLRVLRLEGNRLCLPDGAVLSHPHSYVDGRLKRLNPPACTGTDFSTPLEAPRNLTATVGAGQVTLTWDAVPNAASYDLWVWDSLERRWDPLGGALTSTTYTHSVLTDGRNYYYQARARDAGGVRGPWSARGQAIVVTQRFPPPPASLGLYLFYQKYLEVAGVVIVAPSEVSDEKLDEVREVVTAIYSGRPAFFEDLSTNRLRIVIFKPNELHHYIVQLPELWNFGKNYPGVAIRTATGWAALSPESDRACYILIHELAHIIQFALEDQPDGQEFKARVTALYNAALDAGLWRGAYASTNVREYWAETVSYWFREYIFRPEETRGKKLEDYDPEIAKLIAETFGEGAYVPEYCKP